MSWCVKCGGEMVLKEGKYGKFWGCLNFPECKGSKSYRKESLAGKRRTTKEPEAIDNTLYGVMWEW